MRHRNCSTRLGMLVTTLAVALGTATLAEAQTTVCLVARPYTAAGAAAGVPMWGYAQASFTGGACNWASAGAASSPGPRITVPTGVTSLAIYLKNELPVPTSIMIPGLRSTSPGVPSRIAGRASSFTTEVPAGTTGTSAYTWDLASRTGTFMYQSASHVQVQIQMGLYGAVTRDFAAGQAYDAKPSHSSEVVLFYSEIDPTLHNSVATGNYQGLITIPGTVVGTATVMTSTFNYKPRYFLVNGDAYPAASTTVAAGAPGGATLIRFLNAGLRTHVPVLQNGEFELLAEDAFAYPYARRQVEVSLFAGKTMDVLWTPSSGGTYTMYDRSPHLTTDGGGPGGMIAKLTVGGTVTANNDTYGARSDAPLVVAAPGVMGNDSTITTATLDAGPSAGQGTVVLNPDGSFTYTSGGFTGSTSFTYHQTSSNVATVTITVAANVAPVALPGAATTSEDTAVGITLQATDANSDALTYAIGTPPTHGTLSGTGPTRTYTPASNYNGPDSFTFTASDGSLTSSPALVNITVAPVNDAPTAASATTGTPEDTPVAIALAGADVDGDAVTFVITSPPSNGTLSGFNAATGQVTYTPKLNWNGTDTIRFVTRDPSGASSPVATITIPVSPVADNPLAANDSFSTRYNASATLTVLANDADPDGSPLTINNPAGAFPKCFNSSTGALVSQGVACSATQDAVTINSSFNRLTIVPNAASRPSPNPGYRTLTFTYVAKDLGGALSAPATVTVRVLR